MKTKKRTILGAELDRQLEAAEERAKENQRLEPRAVAVKHQNGRTSIRLESGWGFDFDPRILSELRGASESELSEVKILGAGYTIEWTLLDHHFGVGSIIVELLGEKFLKSEIARINGKVKSARKAEAVRENGRLGGRPPGRTSKESAKV